MCCNLRGSNSGKEKRSFPSPKRPNRPWVPNSLTFNVYLGPLLRVKPEGPKSNLSPSTIAKAKKKWSCVPISSLFLKPLKTKRRPLYLKTQSVPRCKHFSSRL